MPVGTVSIDSWEAARIAVAGVEEVRRRELQSACICVRSRDGVKATLTIGSFCEPSTKEAEDLAEEVMKTGHSSPPSGHTTDEISEGFRILSKDEGGEFMGAIAFSTPCDVGSDRGMPHAICRHAVKSLSQDLAIG